jgi:glycerophosphoryl diester phosphodiesterase
MTGHRESGAKVEPGPKPSSLDPRPFLLIGHRGAAGHAPENTLLSIEKALALGADWVEVDVRVSLDGVPVILHDETLERTTSGRGPASSFPLAHLRALDAGAGERIPLAREVLDLLCGRAGLNLEIKDACAAEPLASLLREALEKGWRARDLLVSSFEESALGFVAGGLPEVPLGLLSVTAKPGIATRARALGATALGLPVTAFGREVADEAHGAGLRVFVFTANDEETVLGLREMGADGAFTDFPDIARMVMERAKRRIGESGRKPPQMQNLG